jgi:hypothetical protein
MSDLYLTGYITEDGKLEVQLPEGLKPGQVQLILSLPDEQLPKSHSTGAEVIAMLNETDGWWHNDSITDGASYSLQIRENETKKRNIQW